MLNFSVVNFNTGEEEVAAARPMTLYERVLQIDHIQARRLSKLSGDALEIAAEGIIRHLRACARMDINPDSSAVREVIDDAIDGRRIFAKVNDDELEGDLRLKRNYGYRHAMPG